MKNQAITLVLTAIFFLPLQAMATIPNGSFENWGETQSYELPVDWQSYTAETAIYQTGSSNVYKGENPEGEPHTQHYAILETVNESLAGTLLTGSTTPYIELTHKPDSATYTIRHWDDDMSNFAGGIELYFYYNNHMTNISWEEFHGDEDEFYEVTVNFDGPDFSTDQLEIWAESGETDNCALHIASITIWYNGEAVYEETFENWDGRESQELPEDWFTTDHMPVNQDVVTITKSTQSVHGEYALRLESGYMHTHDGELAYARVESNIDTNLDFPDSLAFHYIHEPADELTYAIAVIEYYHYTEQTGSSYLERQVAQLPPSEEYTQFYINLHPPEDEESNRLVIYFITSDILEGVYVSGNVMYIDNVRYIRGEDDQVNSISRFSDESIFSVYPNPATDYVKFDIPRKMTDKTKISIIDLSGSVISEKAGDCTSRNCVVDMSDLNGGLYILRLTDGKHTFNQRIIVE